jgi:hypothetical protein
VGGRDFRQEAPDVKVAQLLAALSVAVLPVAPAQAGVIEYTATFESVIDNFFPGVAGSGSHWTYLMLGGSTPELTGTLASGQQLRATYSAPAGQQINILPKPASADSLLVAVELWSDSPQGSPFVDTPGTSYTFTGLTGTPPAPSSFLFKEAAGEKFRTSLHFDAGGFSFQSLEMLFDVPAGYGRTFTNHVPSDVVLVVIANWSADAFDPGPLATITRATTSIPEPSMLLLAGAAMAGAALRRRRSGTATGIGIVSACRRRRARTTPST